MPSQTFEGVDGTRLLHIKNLGKHVTMSIEVPGQVHMGITFDPASIPELALAELEAAGADSDLMWSGAKDYGNADHLGWIAGHLDAYIKTQARITAEAKEQAELEAEALEFLNVYRSISGCEPLKEWRQAGGVQEHYLAIARHARTRRARELRAEK